MCVLKSSSLQTTAGPTAVCPQIKAAVVVLKNNFGSHVLWCPLRGTDMRQMQFGQVENTLDYTFAGNVRLRSNDARSRASPAPKQGTRGERILRKKWAILTG